jgi:Putative capsular polysaccharide synthesis protein
MISRIVSESANRLRHNRFLSTVYHEARLRRAGTKHANPILIYQMGKVGSSTVFDSLKSAMLDRPIFHIHFLDPENIQRAESMLWRHFGGHCSVNRWALYESRFVIKHFLQRPIEGIQIISLVREPISRNISSFFANLDLFIPDCSAKFEVGKIGVPDITRHFLRDFHEHTHPLVWFDIEMKRVFGIDVFSSEHLIRRDQGSYVHRRDRVQLLLLRVEDLDKVAVHALQEFLRIKDLELKVANEARRLEYNRVYREFKANLTLPEEYLEQMYESKYARTFYSAQEIDRFRSRWSRR